MSAVILVPPVCLRTTGFLDQNKRKGKGRGMKYWDEEKIRRAMPTEEHIEAFIAEAKAALEDDDDTDTYDSCGRY